MALSVGPASTYFLADSRFRPIAKSPAELCDLDEGLGMLIHAQGVNRGDAPVSLYHADENSGCVLIGDATTRIMLTPEEIQAVYKLLGEILKGASS